MEIAAPQKEHQWLQKFVGEWTVEGGEITESDQPLMNWKGSERVRALGDFWILAESQGDMPEGAASTMIMTLGFDPQKGKFVGTFLAEIATNLWIYEGVLDAAERVLTLDTEGPNMVEEGKLASYQDIIEFVSDDHRIMTSRMLGADGQWRQIMTTHYRKVK